MLDYTPGTYRPGGDRFGRHRVLSPAHALPQTATRLDSSLPIYDNEILIDVTTLCIDSASFRQMRDTAGGQPQGIITQVLRNVATMGKQQNPVTGTGGTLLGTVADLGPRYSNLARVQVGDPVCSLVSLTLTPLALYRIKEVRDSEQIDLDGRAILFDSSAIAKIPPESNLRVCLALLTAAGAAPQADRLARKGQTIYIIGTGKAAVLCAAAIRAKLGDDCEILASSRRPSSIDDFKTLGLADRLFVANAQSPGETMNQVAQLTDGRMADLVFDAANVEGTELSAVLACKPGGRVCFFNLATNFHQAALGAEGVGLDVEMLIGNGYAPEHAQFTLSLYRRNPLVKRWFDARFGG
jgi:L-erythro-3,5-diaminohexanoate dehydrogenase